MDLSPFVDSLRRDLDAAADAAGEDVRAAAQRLLFALDPSVRLVLIDALGSAAAEVGSQLDDAAVEVRLRGRDPELVVLRTDPVHPAVPEPPVPPAPPVPPVPPEPSSADGEAGTARLTLRLPEHLKARAEAAADTAGLSVNQWLVRAVSAALDQPLPPNAPPAPPGRPGRRMSGWAR
jgi:hypothetical protein